jgi:hypothetical protein
MEYVFDRAPISPGNGVALALLSPINSEPLSPHDPFTVTDGERRWPVVDGIPFLRVGREELVTDTISLIDRSDFTGALALLLLDRKKEPLAMSAYGPMKGALGHIRTLEQALLELDFDELGPYLFHRSSVPSYLSGLAPVGGACALSGYLF